MEKNISNRAILLPSIGDPFLLNIWFKLSYPKFKDEVDHVYMVMDCQHNEFIDAKRYLYDKYSSMSGVSVDDSVIPGVGGSLTEIFGKCKHPLFGIIQEDAFVYRSGEINRAFEFIEGGLFDVVGTPMYCYTGILNEYMDSLTNGKWKWLNHLGYAFWQNFFFTSMATLQETNMDFNVQTWHKGSYLPFLGIKTPADISLDIMASVSLQLYALKKRIKYVSQHLSLDNDCWYPLDVNYWQHVKALSSIYPFMEKTEWGEEKTDQFKVEIERRVSWWQFALSVYPPDEIKYIRPLYIKYSSTVRKIINKYRLNLENINTRVEIMKNLFSL